MIVHKLPNTPMQLAKLAVHSKRGFKFHHFR